MVEAVLGRADARLRVTYIGHATLLLRFGETNILTDPNFDLKLGAFLPRVSAPGIELADLPRVDAILLTHAHADHLSFRSLRALPADIPIYAPPVIAHWLRRSGLASAQPMAAGTSIRVGRVSITAAMAKHMGARYALDRWRSAAHMYLLDDSSSSVLFAGDTALTPVAIDLAHQIAPRRIDVALLPIGYAPRWKEYFFRRGHLTAGDALSFFDQLNADVLIPFHWGTFRHITSGPFDAIRVLRTLVPAHTRASDVRILEPGETHELPTFGG
jgi:L-ascorbate metabolism protein UlaG (beta-lactamase superfamily)